MLFDRENRVLSSPDCIAAGNIPLSADSSPAIRLEINRLQEGPSVKQPEALEQYLEQVLRTCWDWAKGRIHYPDAAATEHPNLSHSIFPEAEQLMNSESKEALGILDLKVSTRIVGRRRYKRDDIPLGSSNSPAIELELKLNVTTLNDTFSLTRCIICYLTGSPTQDTLQEAYQLSITKEAQSQLNRISERLSAQLDQVEISNGIFTEYAEAVTINHQGFEQIQLETWSEMESLISRAVEEVGQAIMRGLAIPFPENIKDPRYSLLMKSFKSSQKADSQDAALTALKYYIYKKIPGCTWTMNQAEYYLTKTTNTNQFEGENFTTPRFAFSILINIFSNKKYVGTIARDFEIGARYDEISEQWQVYTSLTQTPEEITAEIKELQKDWTRKIYIGHRLEERNMRRYFQSPMSPYQS